MKKWGKADLNIGGGGLTLFGALEYNHLHHLNMVFFFLKLFLIEHNILHAITYLVTFVCIFEHF